MVHASGVVPEWRTSAAMNGDAGASMAAIPCVGSNADGTGARGRESAARVDPRADKRGTKLKQQVCDKVVRELLKADTEGESPPPAAVSA